MATAEEKAAAKAAADAKKAEEKAAAEAAADALAATTPKPKAAPRKAHCVCGRCQ